MEAAQVLRVAGSPAATRNADEALRAELALIAIYRATDARLRREIRAAILRGAVGTAGYDFRARQAVREELRKLGVRTRPLATAAAIAGYLQGLRIARSAPNGTPAQLFGGEFGGVHVAAVSQIVEAINQDLSRTVATVGRSTDDIFRDIGLREVGIGLARGAGPRPISKGIERELLAEGLTAFTKRNGARLSLRDYAEIVAITTTREAVTAAVVRDMQLHERDLIAISEHFGSCKICKPYEGKTYSLSGADSKFPRAILLPPFHPRCRHSAYPSRENIFKLYPGLRRSRSSAGGPGGAGGQPPSPGPPTAGGSSGGGTAPSEHLDVQTPNLPEQAHRGIEILDRVLTLPNPADRIHSSPKHVAVKLLNDNAAEEGKFTARVRRTDWKLLSPMIRIRRRTTRPAAVFVHEFGHYLDAIFPFSTQGSAAAAGASEMAGWMRAIKRTAAYRRLKDLESGAMLRTFSGERTPDPAFVDYLLDPSELFARAFSQWLLMRAGRLDLDPLPEALTLRRYPASWTAEDFAPVAAELDRLFGGLGWLRS